MRFNATGKKNFLFVCLLDFSAAVDGGALDESADPAFQAFPSDSVALRSGEHDRDGDTDEGGAERQLVGELRRRDISRVGCAPCDPQRYIRTD